MSVFSGHEACGILAPQPGIEPTPPALEGEVLTTGLAWLFKMFILFGILSLSPYWNERPTRMGMLSVLFTAVSLACRTVSGMW